MSERSYTAIDLKSFYASVECIEREHIHELLKYSRKDTMINEDIQYLNVEEYLKDLYSK